MNQLYDEALWIISHPWDSGQVDNENCGTPLQHLGLDYINSYYANKIHEYLNAWDVKNKLVVLDNKLKITPVFKNYSRVDSNNFKSFVYNTGIKKLVYTGFHYAQCILEDPWSGVITMKSQGYQCYIARDLCCLRVDKSWIEADEKSKKHAKLI